MCRTMKPDIYKIIHGQGEFRPDEIKGETGKIKVRGIFLYRILYISENVDRMPGDVGRKRAC